jgi:hypothetical protein
MTCVNLQEPLILIWRKKNEKHLSGSKEHGN